MLAAWLLLAARLRCIAIATVEYKLDLESLFYGCDKGRVNSRLCYYVGRCWDLVKNIVFNTLKLWL